VIATLQCYASNRAAPQCSQMVFQKDKRGTSMRHSPLSPTLTLNTTTTCPTATSKMNIHAPKRKTEAKSPSKTIASRSRDSRARQAPQHPKSLSLVPHRQLRRMRPKITTGRSHLQPNIAPFLVTPIAVLTTIPQEWVKLPSFTI